MSETKIGRGVLTTSHPSSSYGTPVYLLDGVAYGPEDRLSGVMAGSVLTTCDAVTMSRLLEDAIAALTRWYRQSVMHGNRWSDATRRAQAVPDAEYPDEGVGAKD